MLAQVGTHARTSGWGLDESPIPTGGMAERLKALVC